MRFALVFNPFSYKLHEENLRIVEKYFGLFPPLSLAWTAAIAEKAGHEVIIVDARTLRLSMEDTFNRLNEFKPDIMGFTLTTDMYPETLSWIRYLKERINVPVVVGGYNLKIYPAESVMPPEIDFGVAEHAYYTIPALLKELEGNKDFKNVPGLIYKDKGIINTTPHPQRIDFNLFPFPARHLLPNELYAEFPTERKNFTVAITSLGCPYKCNFCEAGGTVFSPRDAVKVADEFEECYTKYKIREIDIFDYNFTTDAERVSKICSEIKKRKLALTWACRSRVNVAPELLKEMKSAGCTRIYYGIESGNEEILKKINKGITLKQVKETIKTTKGIGIKALGYFLIGSPGETKDTVKETVRFARSLGLDYVQFSKFIAKPFTTYSEEQIKISGQDYWCGWVLGKTQDKSIPRPWTVLTNEQVDKLTKNAYLSFYGRLSFLLKAVFAVRSFSELKRKVLSFLEMVFSQENVSKKAAKI
jgi:radical SAM superfamily enzyme YgiQ (UPF0313 family)